MFLESGVRREQQHCLDRSSGHVVGGCSTTTSLTPATKHSRRSAGNGTVTRRGWLVLLLATCMPKEIANLLQSQDEFGFMFAVCTEVFSLGETHTAQGSRSWTVTQTRSCRRQSADATKGCHTRMISSTRFARLGSIGWYSFAVMEHLGSGGTVLPWRRRATGDACAAHPCTTPRSEVLKRTRRRQGLGRVLDPFLGSFSFPNPLLDIHKIHKLFGLVSVVALILRHSVSITLT